MALQTEKTGNSQTLRERWLLLALLGVFFTALAAILTYPAERILFNPAPYKQALAEQAVSEQFPLYLGQIIQGEGNLLFFGSGSQILGVLERSHYDAVIRLIFPGDWVQAQAEALIDQFWAFFNFQTPRFHLLVDFTPVKARLNGPETPQIAAEIVQTFPPCQAQDLLNFGQQLFQGQVDHLPLCKPPDVLLGAANLAMSETLRSTALVMPDQLDLAALLRLPEALGGTRISAAWSLGFGVYRVARQVDRVMPWLALVLLALVGWLARGTDRGPAFWVGTALILPGIASLLAVLMIWIVSRGLAPLLVGQALGENSPWASLVIAILTRVFGSYAAWTAIAAWGVTIIGAGLVAASVWARRSAKNMG